MERAQYGAFAADLAILAFPPTRAMSIQARTSYVVARSITNMTRGQGPKILREVRALTKSELLQSTRKTARLGENAFSAKEGSNARVNKLMPHSEPAGPHSSFKFDIHTGKINGYETYDFNAFTGKWSPKLRFRGSGKPHGNVEPPFILEREVGKGPGATPIVPRKPQLWELPYGY